MGFRWTRWQEQTRFVETIVQAWTGRSNAELLMLLNPGWSTPTSQGVCQSLPTQHLCGLVKWQSMHGSKYI
jgi:hypothetical protein